MRLGLYINRLIFADYAPFLEFAVPTECDTLQISELEGDMELFLTDETARGGDFLKILLESTGPYRLTLSGPQASAMEIQISASGLVLYLVFHSGIGKYVAIASSSNGGGLITLFDGSGTTADGAAVDLGGPLTKDAVIDTGIYDFQLKKGDSGIKVHQEEMFHAGAGFSATPDYDTVVWDMTRTPDDHIIYVGYFSSYKGVTANKIVKTDLFGNVDAAFSTNIGTGFSGPEYEDTPVSVVADASGIYVGGSFKFFQGATVNGIVKINHDGTVNTTFATNTLGAIPLGEYVSTLALVPTGGIYVGGSFQTWQGASRFGFVKLSANGVVDTAFHAAGAGPDYGPREILVQADGKILMSGYFNTINGFPSSYIGRMNPDGTRDTSFLVGTGLSDNAYAMAQQPDGKILISGYELKINGTGEPSGQGLLRLNTNGTYDSTFVGSGPQDAPTDIVVTADGTIYLAGYIQIYNDVYYDDLNIIGPFKVSPDNVPDTAFLPVYSGNSECLLYIPEVNRIVIGGWMSELNGEPISRGISVLDASSAEDKVSDETGLTALTVYGTPLGYATDLTPKFKPFSLPHKKYVDDEIAKLQGYNGLTRTGYITGLGGTVTNDPTNIYVDTSLLFKKDVGTISIGGGAFMRLDSTVWHAEKQADGSVFVCGSFRNVGTTPADAFTKLVGPNFVSAGGAWTALTFSENATVMNFQIQADGKPVIIGRFSTVNGVARRGIARLNTDGTLDMTFNPGTGIDETNYIADLAIQADGKIVVVGDFKKYNGINAVRCVRINTDGSIDATFATNLGLGFVSPGWVGPAPMFRVLIQPAINKPLRWHFRRVCETVLPVFTMLALRAKTLRFTINLKKKVSLMFDCMLCLPDGTANWFMNG